MQNKERKRNKEKIYNVNELSVEEIEEALRNNDANMAMPINNSNALEEINKRDLIEDKINKIVAILLWKYYIMFDKVSNEFAEADYKLRRLSLMCNNRA